LDWWSAILLALCLGMDAFAVSLAAGLGLREVNGGHVIRLSLHFGFFQFLMPVLGWLAGLTVNQWISAFDHWLAFGLLAAIGAKMIWEASHDEVQRANRGDPTRGWMLLTLSVAVSLDALAVGLSLAFLEVSVWMPSVVIGVVAAGLTAVGILFGSRLGLRFGQWAERLGGLLLIGIGVRILLGA
jgi:putative Mn2+ efflux pump MntP